MRGWGPGIAACRRSVSVRQAWRRGRVSMALGLGRSSMWLGVLGGYVSGGKRERSSVRKADWREGWRESSCIR